MAEQKPESCQQGELSKEEQEALEGIHYIRPGAPVPPEIVQECLRSTKIT